MGWVGPANPLLAVSSTFTFLVGLMGILVCSVRLFILVVGPRRMAAIRARCPFSLPRGVVNFILR